MILRRQPTMNARLAFSSTSYTMTLLYLLRLCLWSVVVMSQSSLPQHQIRYFSDFSQYDDDGGGGNGGGTGTTSTSSSRIINGQNAPQDRYPYFVALFDKNDNLRCGGTLIAPNIVLSAAHCQ
jgi:hypothetical protein